MTSIRPVSVCTHKHWLVLDARLAAFAWQDNTLRDLPVCAALEEAAVSLGHDFGFFLAHSVQSASTKFCNMQRSIKRLHRKLTYLIAEFQAGERLRFEAAAGMPVPARRPLSLLMNDVFSNFPFMWRVSCIAAAKRAAAQSARSSATGGAAPAAASSSAAPAASHAPARRGSKCS